MKIIQDHEGEKLCRTPDTFMNTPLHIAAEKGNLEALVQLLEHFSVKSDVKNVFGKTAMHLAAEKGHVHIITKLECCNNCSDMVKSTDEDGDTPLHLTCKYGYVEVARHLIKMGGDVEARNAVFWTPMDCAAHYGHARVIDLLASVKANIDSKDKLKTTPLQLAAKEGHVTAVEALLKHHASVSSLDNRHFNALDWAIENGHSDVAEAIIKSRMWKSALNNYTCTQDGEMTSPFRKLIQRMPDVAEMVLNKCTAQTNAKDENTKSDSKEYTVTFDYCFLEDRERAMEWKEEVCQPFEGEEKDKLRRKLQKPKHPMKVMVDSKRTRLLKHPLVYNMIEHKWNKYGYCFFYSMLTIHVLFVILLMAYALVLQNPFSPTCVAVFSGQLDLTQPGDQVPINTSQLEPPHDSNFMEYVDTMNITVINSTAILDGHTRCFNMTADVREAVASVAPLEQICGNCGQNAMELQFLLVAAVLIILYSICRLILEVVYFIQQLHHYVLDIATWVDVPLFICAIIFASVVRNDCYCPQEWQWQVGIAAVFLVWAHLILYMRRMRILDTGIYVLMFKNIFIRFLKLTILTVLLLLMFALTFYMAFRQFDLLFRRSPFASPLHSIWKTVAMSFGGLDYDELFRQPTGGSSVDVPGIPFPEISFILWITFVILMPILFGNLLVGLAVDDIKGILEEAALTRLALRVELVLSLEDRFGWFLQWSKLLQDHSNVLSIDPHKKSAPRLLSPWIESLRGEDYCSAENISQVLNPVKTPLEQQTQTLMREISKMQETLNEIPKMQEALNRLLKQSESNPDT